MGKRHRWVLWGGLAVIALVPVWQHVSESGQVKVSDRSAELIDSLRLEAPAAGGDWGNDIKAVRFWTPGAGYQLTPALDFSSGGPYSYGAYNNGVMNDNDDIYIETDLPSTPMVEQPFKEICDLATLRVKDWFPDTGLNDVSVEDAFGSIVVFGPVHPIDSSDGCRLEWGHSPSNPANRRRPNPTLSGTN